MYLIFIENIKNELWVKLLPTADTVEIYMYSKENSVKWGCKGDFFLKKGGKLKLFGYRLISISGN